MLEQFGNMWEVIKRIQEHMEGVQDGLKNEHIEFCSGDVVKVIINGQQSLIKIEINQKYLHADNALLLQELLVACINGALQKSRDIQQEAMNNLAAELNLPKIPGLF